MVEGIWCEIFVIREQELQGWRWRSQEGIVNDKRWLPLDRPYHKAGSHILIHEGLWTLTNNKDDGQKVPSNHSIIIISQYTMPSMNIWRIHVSPTLHIFSLLQLYQFSLRKVRVQIALMGLEYVKHVSNMYIALTAWDMVSIKSSEQSTEKLNLVPQWLYQRLLTWLMAWCF